MANNSIDGNVASSKARILEFWAPWCIPCKRMAPALNRVEKRYAGRVILQRVNADKQTELVREYGIRSIPTLIVLTDGNERKRVTGMQSEATLDALFQAAVEGRLDQQTGMRMVDRILRLGGGGILLLLGIGLGPNWWLVGLGGLLAFWGWYDRCPIWQAIWPRISGLFRRPAAR